MAGADWSVAKQVEVDPAAADLVDSQIDRAMFSFRGLARDVPAGEGTSNLSSAPAPVGTKRTRAPTVWDRVRGFTLFFLETLAEVPADKTVSDPARRPDRQVASRLRIA